MAVVKIRYTRRRAHVKAHLRYITHRPGRENGRTSRLLFDASGLTDKARIYQMIDEAPRGTVFYKIVLSPDPAREDTYKDLDLVHLTTHTMLQLQNRLRRPVPFIATQHSDHTAHRHVHAIALIRGRLSRQEFRLLATSARASATQNARLQRRAGDRVRENPRSPARSQSQTFSAPVGLKRRGRGGRAPRMQPGCSACGYGRFTGIPYFHFRCPSCRVFLTKRPLLRSLEVRR